MPAEVRESGLPDRDAPPPDPWLLTAVTSAIGERGHRWTVTAAVDRESPWILVEPVDRALPQQGWKLHVSSDTATAGDTLARALPSLIEAEVAFKVLGSTSWLDDLNRGAAGLPQVGKFITVYPTDETAAVDIATVLDRATDGLRGPRVPSDHPLTGAGVVSYRFGGFTDLCMQTRLGEIVPALATPDGPLIPDRREVMPADPPWASDPFRAGGFEPPAEPHATVGGRYRPVATLARSPGAVVQLAIDLATPRVCVLKRCQVRPTRAGTSAGWPLRREAEVLRQLAGLGVVPTLFDVVEDGDELVLVLEDIGGETLDRYVHASTGKGELLSTARVVELGAAIADTLAALHDRGRVHGDLKSGNVVIAPDGRPRLIDFDLAYEIGARTRPAGTGTRGYLSPEGRAGEPVAAADDIYALGAVLYLLVSGAEPSRSPDPRHLLNRSPLHLNADADPAVISVLERCLSARAADRYGRATDVAHALRATLASSPTTGPGTTARAAPPTDPATRGAVEQARLAADNLCAEGHATGDGLTWRSTYFVGKGVVGRDLNSGMAGTLLALCELVDEFGVQRHADVLRAGAWTLHRLPPIPGDLPRGLYVGATGPVVSLLRVGQVLSDGDLVQAAVDRASRLPSVEPDDSPDLFHGIAGRIRADLLLWDEVGDDAILDRAVAAAEVLLEQRERDGQHACWRIPPGYGGLSGQTYLGYAHGAAGIADVLLDLAEVTGELRYLTVAGQAIRWIDSQAIAVLGDRSGLGWPAAPGQPPSAPFWCHGAAGIGQLYLTALNHDLDVDPTARLPGITRAVARGARWSGPTLCHGLAGNAEFLLDASRATGNEHAAAQAHDLMTIADAFSIDTEAGRAWISAAPRQVTPDYMVGFAGIPLVLVRLARPERPRQLSRAGFRYRTPTT